MTANLADLAIGIDVDDDLTSDFDAAARKVERFEQQITHSRPFTPYNGRMDTAGTVKKCSSCGESKTLDEFNRMTSGKLGRQSRCRECQRVSQAAYRKRNRDELNRKAVEYQRSNPDRRRSNHLLNRYGITLEQKRELLADQGGRCAVCRDGDADLWVVDHDHSCCPSAKTCGECIRGVLCHPCNIMLGSAQDDPDRLRAAIAYLTGRELR